MKGEVAASGPRSTELGQGHGVRLQLPRGGRAGKEMRGPTWHTQEQVCKPDPNPQELPMQPPCLDRGTDRPWGREHTGLDQWQGTPQSEPPPGPWELPVISDILLKDLDREETGWQVRPVTLCPTSCLSPPANTDQTPGPGHPGYPAP